MDKYKLSIIVPTFNLEDKIAKTFNSIKKQTIGFENIEVIFVDDKSSDNTVRILNNYVSSFKNVSFYSTKTNSGFAGKPRNIGLKHSTSDFVMFLDGDDELLKNSCEVLSNKIFHDNCDVVIGGQINRFDGIQQHNPALFYSEERIFENPIDIELLNIAPAITAKIFRRQLLVENGIKFQEEIPGQDFIFLIEALLNSKRTVTLNDFYVYFRNVSHSSVTFNIDEKYLYGLIKAYTLVSNLLEKFNLPQDIQEVVFFKHINFFTTQILRALSSKKIDSNKISEILNSKDFKNLSERDVFKNNEIYAQYFINMTNGNYENQGLLKKIVENRNLNYYDNLDDNFNQLNQKYDELNKVKDDLSSEINKLTNLNSNLNEECTNLKNECDNLNNVCKELNNDKNNLKHQINNLNDKCNNLKNKNDELNKVKDDLSSEINKLNDLNSNLNNECANLKNKNDGLNNLNSQLSNESVNLKNRLVDLKIINTELHENFTKLKKELNYLKKQQSKINDQNNYLTNNNTNLINENKELKQELDEIKSSKLWKLKNKF